MKLQMKLRVIPGQRSFEPKQMSKVLNHIMSLLTAMLNKVANIDFSLSLTWRIIEQFRSLTFLTVLSLQAEHSSTTSEVSESTIRL